eukprot:GHVU01043679.1.p2 GENE.GHVU01043679.1~~GHVU01043679.1.p2  ORF type:complete len:206 (-),score=37.58 GHVU01043679.1:1478-2095(-)
MLGYVLRRGARGAVRIPSLSIKGSTTLPFLRETPWVTLSRSPTRGFAGDASGSQTGPEAGGGGDDVKAGPDPETHSDFSPQHRQVDFESVKKKLKDLVEREKIVLFMKGTPETPLCGFSARVVGILKDANIGDFTYVDVLKNPSVREGVKQLSDWPTLPQLFVNGEFVGGCDILEEARKSGELQRIVAAADQGNDNSSSSGNETK